MKEVERQTGSGERGSRVREIEGREEMRDPSEPPLFVLIDFPFSFTLFAVNIVNILF